MWAKFAVQAVIGADLYLFGDFGGYHFDAATGRWRPLPAPPRVLAMAQAVVWRDEIHVLGGLDPHGRRDAVHLVFDLATEAWRDGLAAVR